MTSASRSKGEDVLAIAAGLTDLEAMLLTDKASGWGSWMWMVAQDLCAKGLMERRSETEIRFTSLGTAVRQHLTDQEGHNQ